jgi:hypothetical protein
MICTFCGTENPQENRFCGICGVRLERRKTERRTVQRENTACAECGHVNDSRFKFCGMCGAKIDQRMRERRGTEETARAPSIANAQLPTPEARRPAPRREPAMAGARTATLAAGSSERSQRDAVLRTQHEVSAGVSGPSFLGLNDPDAGAEYLLEDEGSSHRGLRAFLLLIVLAAIVGLIFVQYRSSLKANPRSPAPPSPGPATVPRSEGKNRPPGQEKALQTATAARSLQSAVTAVATAANSPLNANASPDAKQKGAEQDDPPDDAVADNKSDPPAATDNQPSPALVKAQQYLHGHGVRQNCEQGLIYLRAAARENDPQAAVQMGALYSSGVCVARDRVKAYEWFSSARELQPDNRWITKNLSELRAHMTPQERQQIHE